MLIEKNGCNACFTEIYVIPKRRIPIRVGNRRETGLVTTDRGESVLLVAPRRGLVYERLVCRL